MKGQKVTASQGRVRQQRTETPQTKPSTATRGGMASSSNDTADSPASGQGEPTKMNASGKSPRGSKMKSNNNQTATPSKAGGAPGNVKKHTAKRRKSDRGTAIPVAKPVKTRGVKVSSKKKKVSFAKRKGYTVKGIPATSDTESEKPHPDLARHINRGTATEELHDYYEGMSHRVKNPLAGIVHEPLFQGLFREMVPDYDLQIQYHWTAIKNNPQFDEFFSEASVRANRKHQEENFHARPAIRIPIPDHLKAMLVDDWENVTKNQMLVPIPCPKPVNTILDDYLAAEKPKRMVPNAQGKNGNSSQADILEEVVAGLREYFEKCLGRILLYK